jgi:drug/metabolite transporter (DMT)-like permease
MLPIAATLVGVLVLGEPMTALHWLAFGIALLSVLLATLPAKARSAA